MNFANSRYFIKQEFEIQKSSLRIEKRNLFDTIEYEISYEQIDHKKKIQSTINHGALVTAFFFFVIALLFRIAPNYELATFSIFISVLLAVFAFSSRRRTVTINTYDGNKIELYFTKRNKQEVVNFANQIIKASNNYLLNKYGKIDKALPIEPQLDNIQFLRNKEVITEEEYDTLKDQLLGRKNKSSIGFGY